MAQDMRKSEYCNSNFLTQRFLNGEQLGFVSDQMSQTCEGHRWKGDDCRNQGSRRICESSQLIPRPLDYEAHIALTPESSSRCFLQHAIDYCLR